LYLLIKSILCSRWALKDTSSGSRLRNKFGVHPAVSSQKKTFLDPIVQLDVKSSNLFFRRLSLALIKNLLEKVIRRPRPTRIFKVVKLPTCNTTERRLMNLRLRAKCKARLESRLYINSVTDCLCVVLVTRFTKQWNTNRASLKRADSLSVQRKFL